MVGLYCDFNFTISILSRWQESKYGRFYVMSLHIKIQWLKKTKMEGKKLS